MAINLAKRMQLELARLATLHNVGPSFLSSHPLASPIALPAVVEGFASTNDVDLERVRFRPYAISWLPSRLPLLHYKHDTSRPVGEITELYYDERGHLRVRA